MAKWTRRALLKSGLAASAGAVGAKLLGAQTADPANSDSAGAQANAGQVGQAGTTTPVAAANAATPAEMLIPRERLLFDFGWQFQFGHADDPAKDFGFGLMRSGTLTYAKATGEARPATTRFDASGWRQLNLPHDWAVELPFKNDPGLPDHGGKPIGRQYPETSIGWYRRVFTLPQRAAPRRVTVEFDGVFRDAIVFFNGQFLARNFSGYAPFTVDLTDVILYGAPNVLAVRVDATFGEGWFYAGAGIYRHVWLNTYDPLHFAQDGLYVRTQTASSGGRASASSSPAASALTLGAEVVNETAAEKTCQVSWQIAAPDGSEVATAHAAVSLPAGATRTVETTATVDRPELWTLEKPVLYTARATLAAGNAAGDRMETPFGIRTTRFDANQGFFLNGQPVKIKGTCNHQDHAGVGSALPDRLQTYRVQCLKDMNSNGCRTSHNPPAPEFIDACDRLGMVVMCETRMMSSSPEGLSQLERMVRKFRNCPSIVLWSLGNEEPEQNSPTGAHVTASMKRLVRALDPTRPVTAAMNGGWSQIEKGQPVRQGVSSVIDVQGCNYNEQSIDEYHKNFPQTPMIGSETASAVATRGVYFADPERGYVDDYDTNVPGHANIPGRTNGASYAKTAEQWWKFYAARPFLAGGFAWTGFDYRGEPSPYGWPCISSHFGILDSCGFPKDTYYYYQAWWGTKPVLHLFPHWNWSGKEGQPIPVWCHTNLDSVELFLNGASLGVKTVESNSHVEWQVPYAPGTLEARGSKGGQVVLTEKRETTGESRKLILTPDRKTMAADGEDVVLLRIEVQDAQDRLVATASDPVTFKITGPGKLIGVGNGDPSCHESDKGDTRSAFNGLCMGFLQATGEPGEIAVEITAPGLLGALKLVQSVAATPRPAVAP